MKIITAEAFRTVDERTSIQTEDTELDQTVLEIIQKVRENGDEALSAYTETLDGVKLNDLIVSEQEFDEARQWVDSEFLTSIQQAKENITIFHQAQTEQSWFLNQGTEIMLGQKVTPLETVGVYIPGGKAAYPSSVLMNVIPAKLAGVENIQIVTPPLKNGKVNPYVLVAAAESGVDRIYKVGGAQAIAALAYGTETIEKVAKIVGPGNAYVARAKKWVFGDVAIDMIAGPSEICVVADETANPTFIAADLLSQAEHDESASAICVTTSAELADNVIAEIERQSATLERKATIQQSLDQNGKIIIAENIIDALSVANEIAPEHLELMVENPSEKLPYIKHAGAIFLGNYTPEPLGDYLAGPNHTLPTNGTARFASPLGVYDFVKKSSVISYSQEALLKSADQIKTLANTEELTAHASAIEVRKDDLDA
ncbi:histidinol dehydrogenase [Virgibacillus sp. NKC19-3]|uniref:histidinol dehydrogenase n=1 Tax=Virgibacillus saliphilus TaxID=2831674 RepID=UPI001C9AA6D4|nr:histidinol dehydrogenase [Virgibacillus sp. NKC19-3]MBY7142242.1 histidinol dehydrogenase [Virgibacillus sp. NKC19-3]